MTPESEGPAGEGTVYQSRRRRSGKGGIPPWAWLVVLALLIGGGVWYWTRSRTEVSPTPVRVAEPDSGVVEPAEPVLNVPPLDESDGVLRDLLLGLSNNPEWARWLVPDDLVRRFVVAVVNVAQGESPRDQVGFMEPEGTFAVQEAEGRLTVDLASYSRYDLAVATFLSLDTGQSARYYRLLHPLFEEAHAELGLPDRTFDQSMALAIDNLLAVEIPGEDVEVVPNESLYDYADPGLQARTPADKHLLRLGPENARAIQIKLTELAVALGFR